MQVPAQRDAALGCAAIVAKASHKPSSDKKRFGQSKGQNAPSPALFAAECDASIRSGGRGLRMRTQPGGPWTPNAYSAPMSNFTRLDPGRPEIAILMGRTSHLRSAVGPDMGDKTHCVVAYTYSPRVRGVETPKTVGANPHIGAVDAVKPFKEGSRVSEVAIALGIGRPSVSRALEDAGIRSTISTPVGWHLSPTHGKFECPQGEISPLAA
jgi:hypothetical protein